MESTDGSHGYKCCTTIQRIERKLCEWSTPVAAVDTTLAHLCERRATVQSMEHTDDFSCCNGCRTICASNNSSKDGWYRRAQSIQLLHNDTRFEQHVHESNRAMTSVAATVARCYTPRATVPLIDRPENRPQRIVDTYMV